MTPNTNAKALSGPARSLKYHRSHPISLLDLHLVVPESFRSQQDPLQASSIPLYPLEITRLYLPHSLTLRPQDSLHGCVDLDFVPFIVEE